jgi:hypothetical protein
MCVYVLCVLMCVMCVLCVLCVLCDTLLLLLMGYLSSAHFYHVDTPRQIKGFFKMYESILMCPILLLLLVCYLCYYCLRILMLNAVLPY